MTKAEVAHSQDLHPDTMAFLSHAVSNINQALISNISGLGDKVAQAVAGMAGINGAQIAAAPTGPAQVGSSQASSAANQRT